ncbi:MAG: serine/threonine protein kinase [Deltaproteobacteria bacterium]
MKKPLPFGKYLLLDRINVGGMAEVFLAKAFGVEGFERILAIKKILPTMVEDEEFISMFIDEARIAVQLNHANVVQIHELGKHEEHYYIAMEYVSGRDLRLMLDGAKKRKQLLSIPQAAFLAQKACEGLDYAHRKKDPQGRDLHIVHRDVSPQNVLVSFEGEVKIIDFGIAKAQGRLQKTQAGILKGKFGYMSPEQVRGLPIDRRSDIFAVGVILYEMLTGERLFVGESDFSTLEKVRAADVLPPRQFNAEIPEALEKVMLKALAREPEDRYQWASDMAEDLMRFLVQGDLVYGTKQLAAFMRERFAADVERERERLARFSSVEKTESSGPAAAPGESPPSAPASSGVGIRASATIPFEAIPSALDADDDPPPAEATQLFRPEFMAGAAASDTGPLEPVAAAVPRPVDVNARTVIRADPSGPRVAPSAPRSESSLRAVATSASEAAVSGALPASRTAPLPSTEGNTVIRAEPSNPRAASGSRVLPPAVRPVPQVVPAGPSASPRRIAPPLLAAAGAAAVVILASLIAILVKRSPPAPGTLIISPHPFDGASISIDGNAIAPAEHHTFVAGQLAPGSHLIEARNQSGQRVLKVRVEAGHVIPIDIQLALPPAPAPPAVSKSAVTVAPPPVLPGRGPPASGLPHGLGLDLSGTPSAPPEAPVTVTLEAEPPDAQIFVDGSPVAVGNYVLSEADPRHRYRFKATAPGHQAVERSGRFERSETIRLVLRGERPVSAPHERPAPHRRAVRGPPGNLIISSRPVAKVFVDGRPTERYTPVPPSDPLELPSGDHVIHLESDDGKKADRHITIEPHALNKLINVVLD